MPETFDVDHVLANISEQDKIAILSGIDFWHTHPIPEFNVPSIRATDGPNGIRGTKFFAGIPAACLPCGTALGATWDRDLIYKAGELLGDECITKGAHCWLGPTINMQRAPLGGRGFESFAEDPHLSGILAKSIILGCESKGVISTVKHFVGNDQEHERRAVDVLVTQRALREIYLRPFQIAARDANPGAIMTSYNKINGKHVVEDARMINLIREEWKWNPLVMSDWYGTYTTIDSMNAGLDLEMPGVSRYRGKFIESAVQARLIKQSTIDARARKVLEFVKQASQVQVSEVEQGRNFPEDRALNRKVCANSIVLLKNEGILPLSRELKKIALIGSHMKTPAISGGGSASLEPYYSVSLYDACREALPNAEILYEAGAYAHRMLPVIDRLLSNAVIFFYNEPMGEERHLLSTEPVSTTAFQFMDYYAPGLNRGLFWATLIGDFTPDSSGLWDFGLSVFGTANLYINDELVIDNTTSQTRGTAFFGKGTIEELGSKELVAGTTYKIRIEFGSANTSTMKSVGMVNFGGGAANLGACLRMNQDEMIENAVKAAVEADYTILCTGLNKDWESEGFDRTHMDLPPGVDQLISKVLKAAGDKTVIVNQSGTPVTMPWVDQAPCIVQAWYGGNETGHGIADVLFGEVNPCAKLPLSWPADVKHNPAYLNYASVGGRVLYGEDIYAGYRFYEKTGREVLFPFGHGLSYTTFKVSPNVTVTPEIFNMDHPTVATVQIKNTGKLAGAQILQLYISAPESPTPRPNKELHGFEKVFLQPGEEKTVDIQVDRYATSFWDEIEDMWKSEQGTYEVLIGTSSQEVVARDTWGAKILDAVERQERLLSESLSLNRSPPLFSQQASPSPVDEVDSESISRNDAPKTPITGSDMILSWPIFPKEKPASTFPMAAYSEKPDRFQTALPSLDPQRLLELREIFMTKIWTKNPIVDPEQLDFHIARVLENGIEWSASSCLVLLIFALAAIWGNYPDDETREVSYNEPSFSPPVTYVTMSVPEHRMKESLTFLSMARKRISTAYLDDTLLGVQCLCLFGIWYQYNMEPIPGWKMFRTASMLWQTYRLKHREGKTIRSAQEESLEQRLYWTCLKSECEVRYELTDLPPCDLSLSDFPYSLPGFPTRQPSDSPGWMFSSPSSTDLEAASSYYYLAEIFLRRLLNRARNAVRVLSPDIDLPTIKILAETLTQLEGQLQQWVNCLPHTLRFNMPLESSPGPKEGELMKLSRERYVEVRELLCRAYLYLCIHVPLDPGMAALYGVKASEALLLAVYRIKTEVPFFRHPGSWGACRVRFNHALCLVAGFRAKLTQRPSAEYVTIPPDWADCVRVVIERLKIWGEEGGGIKELSVLLEWLMHGNFEM
ncbi:Glycoside hydrolase, superfamily [Penicillium griseofulvum]|uniref:Probable beta-glucosidase H n=1 Tax=Penicillium patulum TaxID=5078 RepID=A0A135LD23_PENPA|nr:Glycoside hydrolase, superfamily [Penicillium griseofulvum]KXG46867.1 Glycoside hydrolase, superfamily [Penicillium griseofulvum]